MDKSAERFAEISWDEGDIRHALETYGLPVTPHNIHKLRQRCEEAMAEEMIRAGWDFMYNELDSTTGWDINE